LKCYCCSELSFEECCGRWIDHEEVPETPEQLMRSRYSAFNTKSYGYLISTHDPQTRSATDLAGYKEFAESVVFSKLEILSTSSEKNKGVVDFIAHYTNKADGVEASHHEISQFRKQAGVWYYRQGKVK